MVLGMLMDDLRALVLITTWMRLQFNVMVDVNICQVRSWRLLNIRGNSIIITWDAISFALIDHMQTFYLVHHLARKLPAASFATSELTTVIATIARNVYR